MPITLAIKTSGGDATSMQGAETLMTAVDAYTAEFQENFEDTSLVVVNAANPTSILFTVGAAYRHTGTGVYGTGARQGIVADGSAIGIYVNRTGVTIEWLQCKRQNNSANTGRILEHNAAAGATCTVRYCALYLKGTGVLIGLGLQGAINQVLNVYNCTILVDRQVSTANLCRGIWNNRASATINAVNVSILSVGAFADHGMQAAAGTINATNSVVLGSWRVAAYTSCTAGDGGAGHNISGDTSAPGTDTKKSLAAASYYVSATAGSEDLHCLSRAVLAGQTTSGFNASGLFTVDIDGVIRSDWWPGADWITAVVLAGDINVLNPDGATVLNGGSYGFGDRTVDVGFLSTWTIQNTDNITNLNLDAPVAVTLSALVNCSAAIAQVPGTPILPLQQKTFVLYVETLSAAAFSGTISIGSDDPNEDPYNVDFFGVGVAAGAEPDMAGPIQLKGNVYIVTRGQWNGSTMTVSPDYLGGVKVGRLREVIEYKIGAAVSTGSKGTESPSWARISGDWIRIRMTFTDLTDDFIQLAVNNRNSGLNFNPADATKYKLGKLFRASQYTALMIRDEDSPLAYPALYVPYALTIDMGYLSARATKHTEFAELEVISIPYDGDGKPPFEYGDVTLFTGYDGGE